MAQMEDKVSMPGGKQLAGLTSLLPSAEAEEVKPRTKVSGPAQAKAEAAKAAAKTQEESDREAIAGGIQDFVGGTRKLGAAAKDVLTLPGRAIAGAAESVITRPLRAFGVDVPYLPDDFYGGDRSSMTPYMDAISKKEQATALPPIASPSAKPSTPKPQDSVANTMTPRTEASGATQETALEEKAPMGPERPSLIDRAIGNLRDISIEKPAEKTIQSVAKEQAEADKAYGVDNTKMFEDLRNEYKKSGDDLKKRSDKATGMALMMFGVGLAGARKGQEWQTASESGQKALISYMGAMDKINDNEEKLKQRMQDLTMAENQFNRSRSDKALSEVQTNKREIKSIEMENAKLQSHAVTEGAKLTLDYFKNTNPPAYQYLQKIVDEQRARGNKNYTLVDALKDDKTGGARGEVTDKELQDAYEDRRKSYLSKKDLAEFERKYPTWRDFAAKEGRSGGRSTSAPAQQFTEGQESKDANGKPIVFRNGQWVYK
jgi:hypothetical protein